MMNCNTTTEANLAQYKIVQPLQLFPILNLFSPEKPIFTRRNITTSRGSKISTALYQELCQMFHPFKQTKAYQQIKAFVVFIVVIYSVIFPACLAMLSLLIQDYYGEGSMVNFFYMTIFSIVGGFLTVFLYGLCGLQAKIKNQLNLYCENLSLRNQVIVKPVFRKYLCQYEFMSGFYYQGKKE